MDVRKPAFKGLVLLVEISVLLLAFYIIALPFYPSFKYRMLVTENGDDESNKTLIKVMADTEVAINNLPEAEQVYPNWLVIPKIQVNAPIIESSNSEYALSKGAWRDPKGSVPSRGGNTIITGHRFKYLPPNNLTLFLLDKLTKGDIISVVWGNSYYYYKVIEKKIVPPNDASILKQTEESRLTIYTCDPIYSQKNRLVVVAELIED